MRISKIEWFYVSRETKGQSGRQIHFLNNFIQFWMQYVTTIRTSSSQMFFEIGVLKVCNIHSETPVLDPLFSKVANLEAYKFIKKRLQHRCFPFNITNLLRILKTPPVTASVLEIHREFDYINREIDDMYFQYNIACLCYVFLHFNNKYMIAFNTNNKHWNIHIQSCSSF